MKGKIILALLVSLLLTTSLSAKLWAQTGGNIDEIVGNYHDIYYPARFDDADTNHDGVLGPKELRAAQQGFEQYRDVERFKMADANGDGVISYDEAKAQIGYEIQNRKQLVQKAMQDFAARNPGLVKVDSLGNPVLDDETLRNLRRERREDLMNFLNEHPEVRAHWFDRLGEDEIRGLKLTPHELARLSEARPELADDYARLHPAVAEELRARRQARREGQALDEDIRHAERTHLERAYDKDHARRTHEALAKDEEHAIKTHEAIAKDEDHTKRTHLERAHDKEGRARRADDEALVRDDERAAARKHKDTEYKYDDDQAHRKHNDLEYKYDDDKAHRKHWDKEKGYNKNAKRESASKPRREKTNITHRSRGTDIQKAKDR